MARLKTWYVHIAHGDTTPTGHAIHPERAKIATVDTVTIHPQGPDSYATAYVRAATYEAAQDRMLALMHEAVDDE